MREAGIIVNDILKIQVNNANIEDYSIYFPDNGLRIPLSLSGVFSYFNTRSPNDGDLEDELNILYLTPDHNKWNPHNEAYSFNEKSYLDYQSNLIEHNYRTKYIIEEQDAAISSVTEEATQPFVSQLELSINENNMIDAWSCMYVHVPEEALEYREPS